MPFTSGKATGSCRTPRSNSPEYIELRTLPPFRHLERPEMVPTVQDLGPRSVRILEPLVNDDYIPTTHSCPAPSTLSDRPPTPFSPKPCLKRRETNSEDKKVSEDNGWKTCDKIACQKCRRNPARVLTEPVSLDGHILNSSFEEDKAGDLTSEEANNGGEPGKQEILLILGGVFLFLVWGTLLCVGMNVFSSIEDQEFWGVE